MKDLSTSAMYVLNPPTRPTRHPGYDVELESQTTLIEHARKLADFALNAQSELDQLRQCEAIVQRILAIANTDGAIVFEEDCGGNTLTVTVSGRGHTHVGIPDGSFEALVSGLHSTLHDGPGLSWAS